MEKFFINLKIIKNIPSIFYSNSTKNGPHVYNGLIVNPIYFKKKKIWFLRRSSIREVRTPINLN